MARRAVYNARTGRKRMVTVNPTRSRAAKRAARKRLRNPTARRHLKLSLRKTRLRGRTKSGRRSNLGRTAGSHTTIKKGFGNSLTRRFGRGSGGPTR